GRGAVREAQRALRFRDRRARRRALRAGGRRGPVREQQADPPDHHLRQATAGGVQGCAVLARAGVRDRAAAVPRLRGEGGHAARACEGAERRAAEGGRERGVPQVPAGAIRGRGQLRARVGRRGVPRSTARGHEERDGEEIVTRLRAAVPYAAVLAVALYLYHATDAFAAMGREGQLSPAFWPRAVLGLLMLVCAWEIARAA